MRIKQKSRLLRRNSKLPFMLFKRQTQRNNIQCQKQRQLSSHDVSKCPSSIPFNRIASVSVQRAFHILCIQTTTFVV